MDNREVVPNQVYDSNQPIAPYRRLPTRCRYLSDDKIRRIRRSNSPLISFKKEMLRRAHDSKLASRFLCCEIHDRIHGRNSTFDMEERKTFISPRRMYSWHEKVYGIMRVGVYQMDTICVATRKKDFVRLEEDLERIRDGNYWLNAALPDALISEVEDLEFLSDESHDRHNKSSQKTFCVVSMTPGKKKAHRVSGHETAVCALQHLFSRKFKPDQIQVLTRKRDGGTVEVLNVREEPSIEDVLSVINKPQCEGFEEP